MSEVCSAQQAAGVMTVIPEQQILNLKTRENSNSSSSKQLFKPPYSCEIIPFESKSRVKLNAVLKPFEVPAGFGLSSIAVDEVECFLF